VAARAPRPHSLPSVARWSAASAALRQTVRQGMEAWVRSLRSLSSPSDHCASIVKAGTDELSLMLAISEGREKTFAFRIDPLRRPL
jgi:hypothetical protein